MTPVPTTRPQHRLGRPPWSILPCGPFLTVACTREDCDWSRGRLLSRLAADRHGLDHYRTAHGGRR